PRRGARGVTEAGGPLLELGYWLSSEEHGPKALVRNAAAAEAAGFPGPRPGGGPTAPSRERR
ncbi:MAG: hypothetical protein M3066_08670, partial [Actinomycetota bacterium]|nr:hypothetical protein [Actinomycetota bacterium]